MPEKLEAIPIKRNSKGIRYHTANVVREQQENIKQGSDYLWKSPRNVFWRVLGLWKLQNHSIQKSFAYVKFCLSQKFLRKHFYFPDINISRLTIDIHIFIIVTSYKCWPPVTNHRLTSLWLYFAYVSLKKFLDFARLFIFQLWVEFNKRLTNSNSTDSLWTNAMKSLHFHKVKNLIVSAVCCVFFPQDIYHSYSFFCCFFLHSKVKALSLLNNFYAPVFRKPIPAC